MEYKMVFSDVDGTLLDSQKRITPLTEGAIKTLQRKGIPFVIVSGRGPTAVEPIFERYSFRCPMICLNGALIYDEEGNLLFSKAYPKTVAEEVLSFVRKQDMDITCTYYSDKQWLVDSRDDKRIRREEGIVEIVAEEGGLDRVRADYVNKILCMCNREDTCKLEGKLKEQFPDLSVVRSSLYFVEVMQKGVNKAEAIKFYCDRVGADAAQTVAFGDNFNDEEMLEEAGLGFLMANAPEEMKIKFPNHTNDHNDDGIYYALLKLGLI